MKVERSEFDKLRRWASQLGAIMSGSAWEALEIVTLETVRFVKDMMPVDTGRARASWGEWTATDRVKSNPDAKEEDAVLQMKRAALETVQGSNVPYIERLNEGHSKKAPAGFLDMAAEWAETDLEKRLTALRVL